MYKILNVKKDTDFVEQIFEDNLLIENYKFTNYTYFLFNLMKMWILLWVDFVEWFLICMLKTVFTENQTIIWKNVYQWIKNFPQSVVKGNRWMPDELLTFFIKIIFFIEIHKVKTVVIPVSDQEKLSLKDVVHFINQINFTEWRK